jgi:fatty acid desaturase
MSSDLTSTETNSSDESKGRTYGLDGDLFAVAVITLFAALTIFTLLFTIYGWRWFSALIVVGLPAGLVYGWIFGLKQGRPTGYDLDWFEQLTMGTSWGYNPQNQPSRQPVVRRD